MAKLGELGPGVRLPVTADARWRAGKKRGNTSKESVVKNILTGVHFSESSLSVYIPSRLSIYLARYLPSRLDSPRSIPLLLRTLTYLYNGMLLTLVEASDLEYYRVKTPPRLDTEVPRLSRRESEESRCPERRLRKVWLPGRVL